MECSSKLDFFYFLKFGWKFLIKKVFILISNEYKLLFRSEGTVVLIERTRRTDDDNQDTDF